ncbi:site-specific integrase [Streptomyces sp. NRRL S-495]|uniref:tyrosine-type recombinase/integrase n=1 Tax=Streptomyces sp. NRRL S-495 TaxID=1609133 RepID=UPI0005F94AE5|nr:site-specific integrase [Streptomyces sp. NRRL S-495]KJY38812.1 integrase [Streptomyces sp. NRRL S-495]
MTAQKKNRANGEGTVFQRKDGRWEAAAYVLAANGNRQRLHVYGRTRQQAMDKLTDAKAASNRGVPVVHAQGTVGNWMTYWLETVAVHRVRETTHTRYAAVARLYIIPGLGAKKLSKLTARDIRTWLDGLRTRCQCCARRTDHQRPAAKQRCCAVGDCCRRVLSALTLTYIHTVLKTALEHAVQEEEIPRNVARNVRLGTPRPRRFEPLTAEEARQLLDAAPDHPLHSVVHLALHTGLRRGELLGLTWEDIDLNAGTAVIRRSLQRTSDNGLVLFPTKTQASERRIALPVACIQALQEHRVDQQAEHETAGLRWNPHGYIFTAPNTTLPVEPSTLNRRFATLLHQAGLRRIRFHDLRHTTATLLLDQGIELVVIKELLGHAHIGVTATVYTHVRLRIQRNAIDLLGNALGNAKTGPAVRNDGDDPPGGGILVSTR